MLLRCGAGQGMATPQNLVSRSSDIGQEIGINGFAHFELFGQTIWLTTSHVAIVIILLVFTIFAVTVNRAIRKTDPYGKPGMLVNIAEMGVEAIDNMTKSNMGEKHGGNFSNYIGTLLLFVFISNISGLFGLRPPTADFGTTFGLAMITFFLIHIAGFRYQKMRHITDLFHPLPLTPINIIGEIATPISMSLRLFGNVLCGTVIMALIYNLLPSFILWFWPGALHAYFDIFSGAIQSYVFCMLTMVFISNNFED